MRVKSGTNSPNYPVVPIGGWVGVIRQIDLGSSPPYYRIEFNQDTLSQINPIILKRWAKQRVFIKDLRQLWVGEADLESDTGEATVIEQPRIEESRPLDTSNTDDWIRGYMGLTADDPLIAEGDLDINAFRIYFGIVTQARTQQVLKSMFPAIADWVQHHGKIEIGFLGEKSVVAKLMDANGVLFEDTQSKTFADALNELEYAIIQRQHTDSSQ